MSDFLRDLSNQKTQKATSLISRYLKRILLVVLYSTICINVTGLRDDFAEIQKDFSFWLEFGIILTLTLNAVILSTKLSMYGKEKEIKVKTIQLLAISWIGLNVALFFVNSSFYTLSIKQILNKCFLKAFIISFIPALIVVTYYTKKKILYPKWLGLSTFLLSAMSSGIFLQMSCPSRDPWHNLGSHILPVLLISSFGGFLFSYYAKKR